MSTLYPTTLDDDSTLPNIDPTDTMDQTGKDHDAMHTNLANAVRALEAKVGVNASRDTASMDYNLAGSIGQPGFLDYVILSSGPRAYYSLRQDTISGTSVTDLSGNGHTATISSTHEFTRLTPSDPSGLYPILTDFVTCPDALGLTTPMNYSYTVTFTVYSAGATYGLGGAANGFMISAFGLSGETPATNWSCIHPNAASTSFPLFWEYNSGTDSNTSFPLFALNVQPVMIHITKDSTAKRMNLYLNGRAMGSIAYANEPTGGTVTSTNFTFGSVGGVAGHWAYFDGVLSGDAIYAQAKASGLV